MVKEFCQGVELFYYVSQPLRELFTLAKVDVRFAASTLETFARVWSVAFALRIDNGNKETRIFTAICRDNSQPIP